MVLAYFIFTLVLIWTSNILFEMSCSITRSYNCSFVIKRIRPKLFSVYTFRRRLIRGRHFDYVLQIISYESIKRFYVHKTRYGVTICITVHVKTHINKHMHPINRILNSWRKMTFLWDASFSACTWVTLKKQWAFFFGALSSTTKLKEHSFWVC